MAAYAAVETLIITRHADHHFAEEIGRAHV